MATTYQEAIEELKQKASDHGALGEERSQRLSEQAAQQLAGWVANGQQGTCPVDLALYGIVVTEPQLSKAKSEPPLPLVIPLTDGSNPVEMGLSDAQPFVAQVPDLPVDNNALDTEGEDTSQLVQNSLNKALAQAQDFFNQEKFGEAKAMAETILQRPISDKSFEEAVQNLLDRAKTRFNQQLEWFLSGGDEARKAGKLDEAKKQYNLALELSPNNSQALRFLLEMDNLLVGSLSHHESLALSGGLREKRDIVRLGNAVYKAEALESEDKLPPDLRDKLSEARQRYDNLRRIMGEETTMMRFGDLAGRDAAVKSIRKRVEEGEPTTFDVTVNQNRPTADVLNDAMRLHNQGSEDTAQHELDLVNKRLPAYPKWAQKRLQKALTEPFSDLHRRRIQNKLTEIESLVANQDRAEGLLAKTETLTDPLEIFKLVAEAYTIFPHLQGLEERLKQIRQIALETLLAQMRQYHQNATAALATNNYPLAREEVGKGGMIPAGWPETEKPEQLKKLLEDGRNLQHTINTQEKEQREASEQKQRIEQQFTILSATIRQQVPNPNLRQSGLTLYQEVISNPDYQNLPELKILISEMDQYKGISEQLTELREAKANGNWERVRDLAGKIQRSGRAGQFADEVSQMLDLAVRKLNLKELDAKITEAETYLSNDEINQADKIIQGIAIPEAIDQDEEGDKNRKNRLKQRHQTITNTIQECQTATREGRFSLEDLFRYAQTLAEKPGLKERSKALSIYRYVGGDTEQRSLGKAMDVLGADIPEELRIGWPPYKRSLYTALARQEARNMAKQLRQDFLVPLEALYNERDNSSLDENELQLKAEESRLLRENYLLESEKERTIVRWVEVMYGEKTAKGKENSENWKEAVQIWDNLKQNYPVWPSVEAGWRRAHIQKTIVEAKLLLGAQGDSDDANQKRTKALNTLLATQMLLGDSQSGEINLTLADVYVALKQFDQALEAINRASHYSQDEALIEQKRKSINREREIQNVLGEVNGSLSTEPLEAANIAQKFLRRIQDTLQKDLTKDSKELLDKREGIFQLVQELLLQGAKEDQRKGGNEDKIKAVVKLVKLRELEEIVAQPEEKRASGQELTRLRPELLNVIKNVTRETRNFTQNKRLTQTLNDTADLGQRLQTFIRDIPLTDSELGEEKENLRSANDKIIALQEQLKKLENLLNVANESNWQTALQNNNFSELDHLNNQITSIGLNEITDVQDFRQKLVEWQEIHQYFLDQIIQIKSKFSKEENFDEVVRALRLLQARPDTRPKGSNWQQLTSTHYRTIYDLMASHLRVINVFTGGEIVGWADLETEAKQRQEALSLWGKWYGEINQLMSQGQNWVQKIQTHHSGTLVIEQINDWTKLFETADKTLTLLDTPPSSPCHSYKAKSYSDNAKEARSIADHWKNSAEIKLSSFGSEPNFPSPQEFNSAVNDCGRLKVLLERADRIGTKNLAESRRVEHYRKIYQNNCGPNKVRPSIWDRLFNRE